MFEVKYIVLHCADTPDHLEFDAEDIHKWHSDPKPNGNGWDGIGYHKVVKKSGEIQNGRPEYWIGSHTYGYNSKSLSICMIGRYDFTDDQIASVRDIITHWKSKYPDAKVVGHCDLDSSKTCPNISIKKVWPNESAD